VRAKSGEYSDISEKKNGKVSEPVHYIRSGDVGKSPR